MSATVLTLLKDTFTTDSIGQRVPGEQEKTEIFATEVSVSRNEWFAAQNAGLSAEHVFRTPSCNYDGQQFALFGGKKYLIYRTYTTDSETELYLGQKGGIHG